MSDQPTTGRITPYEVVFGTSDFAEREFPVIDEEAKRVSAQSLRRDQFAGLESVGGALAQLVPDGAEPGTLDHFLAILFHGFNFWKAGCPVYAFETEVVRYLLDAPPALADWTPGVATSCFYAEMPRNLFWTAVSEGQPPEPLEGFFVDSLRGASSPEVDVLMIFGMRAERPGFGVVGTTIDLQRMRDVDEPDAFTSEIPGADLAGLYSMQRPSEVGILLERLLWYLDVRTESLERVEANISRQRESSRATSTGLGFYRVSLTSERDRE